MSETQSRPLFTNRSLALLIWPLFVEQLLAVTIGMADTVMVTTVGEAAVSGISLVDSINFLLIQIFAALATGGAVVVSQYLGRRDQDNACKAAKQLLYASALVAFVLMVIALVFNRVLLHGIFGDIEAAVMKNAETYFWLSALSYPSLAIYNAGAALFRSMGNSKVSMYTSLLMNIVNISGNAIFIFGFDMGVAGAALASLLSRTLGAIIMLILVRNPNRPLHIKGLFRPELHFDMVKNILKVGVPNGLENGMFQVGKLLVQGLIASYGTYAIAANAITNTLVGLSNIPGGAIGLAMITVVGQCVGARDYKQAVSYARRLVGLTYLSMTGMYILQFLFAKPLVGIFNLSPEATTLSVDILRWCALFGATIWTPSFIIPNALRAAGDAKFTMITSMLSMWIFRIGFSYILGNFLGMGLQGVWFAMYIDWLVRAIVFVIRFKRGKWKSISLI